jgi:hypothetical protein
MTESSTATNAAGISNRRTAEIVIGTLGTFAALLALALLVLGYVFARQRRRQTTSASEPKCNVREHGYLFGEGGGVVDFEGKIRFGMEQGGLSQGMVDSVVRWGYPASHMISDLRGMLNCQSHNMFHSVFANSHAVTASLDSLMESLEPLSVSEGSRKFVCELVMDPRTRWLAIRHVLSVAIGTNVDIHSIGPLSLLPPNALQFLRSMPESNREPHRELDPMSIGKHLPCIFSILKLSSRAGADLSVLGVTQSRLRETRGDVSALSY